PDQCPVSSGRGSNRGGGGHGGLADSALAGEQQDPHCSHSLAETPRRSSGEPLRYGCSGSTLPAMATRRGRALATVMFTDIVDSSTIGQALGDARWRVLLGRHNEVVRSQLRQYGGRELDTAGDGFFAAFDD